MWPNRENADEEPDWVKNERKQFADFRDKNGDGKLDKTEVREWIIPENFDHARAEARHLIFESDRDKVRLSSWFLFLLFFYFLLYILMFLFFLWFLIFIGSEHALDFFYIGFFP